MKQAIHMTHNRLVAGSNPAGATKFSDVNHTVKPPFEVAFLYLAPIIGSKMAAEFFTLSCQFHLWRMNKYLTSPITTM